MSIDQVLGPGFSGLDDRQKLERTAKELEAVLVTQLLGAMRKTVPEGGIFKKSLADDVFRQMLDSEIARSTAGKSPFGLADAIVKSLENRVKEEHGSTETPNDGHTAAPDARAFRRVG